MIRACITAGLLVLAAATQAAAEWQITPLIGRTLAGNTTLLDLDHGTGNGHGDFGCAVTVLGGGLFGVEGIVIHTPHFFRGDDHIVFKRSSTTSLAGNVVVTAPRRLTEYNLRPFVSAGLGLLHSAAIDTPEVFPLRSTMAGFDLGGGAIGFFSQRTGVRFDIRYHTSLHRPGADTPSIGQVHLRYMTAAIGLVIRR